MSLRAKLPCVKTRIFPSVKTATLRGGPNYWGVQGISIHTTPPELGEFPFIEQRINPIDEQRRQIQALCDNTVNTHVLEVFIQKLQLVSKVLRPSRGACR